MHTFFHIQSFFPKYRCKGHSVIAFLCKFCYLENRKKKKTLLPFDPTLRLDLDLNSLASEHLTPGGGGGTPIEMLYGDVPPKWVGF